MATIVIAAILGFGYLGLAVQKQLGVLAEAASEAGETGGQMTAMEIRSELAMETTKINCPSVTQH